MNRRNFLKTAAIGIPVAAILTTRRLYAAADVHPKGVGMCDWNLGTPANPELIPKAAEAHLSGLQVSIGIEPDSIPLRSSTVRQRYIEPGEVNMPEVSKALHAIQYDKWLCLETSGEKDKFIEDTRDNVAFSKKMFGIV